MELPVAVKIVALADAPSVLPVVAGWYHDAWGREDGVLLETEHLKLAKSLRSESLPATYLALVDGQTAGAAQLKLHEMAQFPALTYWIGSVYVVPWARGRGVAQELVLHAADDAERRGVDTLHLQTEDLTGGLYHRCGWTPLTHTENHGRQVLVMERRLGPNNSFKPNLLRKSA
jgi:GNAT superfamily N-acetyltransferase